MTSFEAAMWVSGGLLAGAVLFGGIGAWAGENKHNDAANILIAIAVTILGMSILTFAKGILGLIIR